MNTSGHVILITGGTSGIGLELVKRLYALGNTLIVASGNPDKLDALKRQFPQVVTLLCDLRKPQDIRNLISTCLYQYPDINILINNAGIQYNYNVLEEENSYDKIEEEIRINLTSPMQLALGLLPILTTKASAAIINVSSGLAFVPKKSAPIYCATKAAIHNGTKALRYQLEKTSVKVFELIPPLVDTAMTQGRGSGKISPQQLVSEFLISFQRDQLEINIGKTKILRVIHRIAPRLADRLLKNS